MNRPGHNPRFALYTLFGIALAISGCGDHGPSGDKKAKIKYNGSMNISRFVYRDVNRNGIYDLGDRPYADQPFLLKSPDGKQVHNSSNISGFTNFKMSLNNPKYPINVAGQYALNAITLPGMLITSSNPEQTLNIAELPGSPGGLISEHTMQPLGVAPELSISGRVKPTSDHSMDQYTLTAISDNGTRQNIDLDSDGYYLLPSHAGQWILKLSDGVTTASRQIVLGGYPVVVSEFNLPAGDRTTSPENTGSVTLIDFDQLTTSDTLYEIPNGYGGLDWHNWITTHHKFYGGAGYINNTTSGEFIAYNSSGHPAQITSNQPFDLVSFTLGVAWSKAEKGTITVSAWRGDELAYRDKLNASTARPVVVAADYRAITRVDFRTSQYWQLVIDDVRYRK